MLEAIPAHGRTSKVTVNLPLYLLSDERRITGKGVTGTGLPKLQHRKRHSALRDLEGKARFRLDLEKTPC